MLCHFQKLLCERLEEQLQNLDTALKKRERAERRCRHTYKITHLTNTLCLFDLWGFPVFGQFIVVYTSSDLRVFTHVVSCL